MTPAQMLRLIEKSKPAATIRPLRQIKDSVISPAMNVCKTCGFVAGRHSNFCPEGGILRDTEAPNVRQVSETAPQVVVHASKAEPWLIEQLESLSCPTCGDEVDLMALHNVEHEVKFYTCEYEPLKHRWAYYYAK